MNKYVLVTLAVDLPDHVDLMDIIQECDLDFHHKDVLNVQLEEVYSSEGKKLF